MKPSANPILIGIIAGLVAAILLMVSPSLPFIGQIAAMTALFLAGLGFGRVAGLIAVASAAIAIGVLSSSLADTIFLGALLLPAAVMSHLASLARPASEIGGPDTALAWYPLSDILLAGAVITAIATACLLLLQPIDYAGQIEQAVLAMKEIRPELTFTSEDKAWLEKTTRTMMPLTVASGVLVQLFAGYYYATRILAAAGRNVRPREDIRSSLRMNRLALGALVAGLALIFVGGNAQVAGAALVGAVGAGFLLAGFAVIHNTWRDKPWALPALVLTYMLSLFLGLLVVVIGLANPRRAIALTPNKPNETSETPN
jgi:hypothetical protein